MFHAPLGTMEQFLRDETQKHPAGRVKPLIHDVIPNPNPRFRIRLTSNGPRTRACTCSCPPLTQLIYLKTARLLANSTSHSQKHSPRYRQQTHRRPPAEHVLEGKEVRPPTDGAERLAHVNNCISWHCCCCCDGVHDVFVVATVV